ncbi:macrophage mannose receptor 1-like isoform X2 [Physella acuta]|uniref:macrophage mannose receptor 1-like isoform X2 n=1 Tax=Physella acuta TaxID=109671 RepID=UPI0027DCB542|nr:macrophage mannose receptor 1-like isoform X2 [Physella acuta]
MAATHRGLYVGFVLVMIQELAKSDQPCEEGWTHHEPSKTCLKHVTQAKNEQDSRAFCQSFRGCGGNRSAGHLVFVQDREMGSFILNMAPNSTRVRVEQTSYSLGQDLSVTSGSEPTPSGPTPQAYVMTSSGLEHWHPSTKNSFICQFQHGCSSPNQDSVYRDSCFHLTTNASLEWTQANRTCVQQGRNLLSLHSLVDNEFLYKLASAYRTNSDYREGMSNTLAIGLHRDNRENKFVWTDNTPYNFSKWRRGEPTFFYKNLSEKCTEMYINSGEWNDIPCVNVKMFGFVCQSKLCSNATYHPRQQVLHEVCARQEELHASPGLL